MLLYSFYYFILLGITTLIYYNVGLKLRWIILFIASLFFIGSFAPKIIIFVLLFSIINYFLGLGLNKYRKTRAGSIIFWFGILFDVGLLTFYKYINFLIENFNFIIGLFPDSTPLPGLSLIIPLGISYYTFQALGYLIRINRGAEKAERNFFLFAIFLSFFPKFLAGPVERSNHFLPQLKNKIEFDPKTVSSGLRLFLFGMFKKVVIANNLQEPVFLVYNDIHHYHGLSLLIILVVQTIHLYCDFSGYTDMALGSARILGIKLIDNFNRPFLARNVGEFWRRWHISLSSWCNDFIFAPFIVKYRKMGAKAAIIGIFLTFFVIGIWHGANWTFVVLGILQGIAISYEFYTKSKRIAIARKLPEQLVLWLSRGLTFLFFCVTLVFFNAHSIQDAWYFITNLSYGINFSLSGHDLIYNKLDFFIALGWFIIIFIAEVYIENGKKLLHYFLNRPVWIRWMVYYVLIAFIYYYYNKQESFIYLQF